MRGSGGGYTDSPRGWAGSASFRVLRDRPARGTGRRAFNRTTALARKRNQYAMPQWQYRVFVKTEPAPMGNTRGRQAAQHSSYAHGLADG